MDGVSSDPRLNPNGGTVIPNTQQGHFLKMFQAYDEAGNIVQNVYLGIMDYPGINYDYNDNLFIIEGVKPVGTGPTASIAGTYPDPLGTPTSDIATATTLSALSVGDFSLTAENDTDTASATTLNTSSYDLYT